MADLSSALLPSVAPETRAPESYQRISANPEAFGASIAKGVEKLGAGLDKASDNAFAVSAFHEKVNADYEGNNFTDAHDKILYGDPAKVTVGPDGQQVRDSGYMGLQGRSASDAREATLAALKDRREEGRANLKSEQSRLDYDVQTRRTYSMAVRAVGQHANGQWKNWAGEVNQDGAKQAGDGYVVAVNANDPEAMSHHASDFISFRVKNAQLKFGDDPTVVRQTISQAKQELLKLQVSAIEVQDPVAAQRVLDKNKEIAGADYTPLAEKLRGRVAQQSGINDARRLVQETSQPYSSLNHPSYATAAASAPGGMSPAGLARTVQIESSGNPNAGAGGGHVGLGQFSVATAAEVGIGNRADPEQSISGIAKYAAKNAPGLQKVLGRAPDDAELYLAHQQGPGGAAKLLANPDARAGDLVGDAAISQNSGDPDAPASSFTSMWKQKFDKAGSAVGTGGNGAQLAHREGNIKLAILSDPKMNADPQRQAAALGFVGQWYAAQREQISQDDAAFKLRVQNTTAEALGTGAVKAPIPREDFVATYGLADGDKQYAEYQANVQLGADLRATAGMSPSEITAKRGEYQPAAGSENYIAQSQRAGALDKAIQQNEAMKAKDPAAFLIQRTDVGAAAFQQFQAAVANPQATPEGRKVAASLYAEKMLAEQARIGVLPDARRVVPEAYTDALISRLNAVPDAQGKMPPIADILEGEAKLWDKHWPTVVRQLDKEAAPVVRVLSAGIKHGAAQTLQQLNGISLSAILKDQDTEKNAAIKKDVLDAFKPFASSLTGNAGGLRTFNDFRGEAEKLAASYVIGGMTSTDAAKKAFEDTLGFKYTFENGYRVPKDGGVSADDVARGTVMALRDLDKGAAPRRSQVDIDSFNAEVKEMDFGEMSSGMPSVRAAGDKTGGLSPEYLRAGKIASLRRDGKWVTAPYEQGLMLTHDGQGVRNADGQAFVLSWKQLGDLADQYRREVRDVTNAGAEGFAWSVPVVPQ